MENDLIGAYRYLHLHSKNISPNTSLHLHFMITSVCAQVENALNSTYIDIHSHSKAIVTGFNWVLWLVPIEAIICIDCLLLYVIRWSMFWLVNTETFICIARPLWQVYSECFDCCKNSPSFALTDYFCMWSNVKCSNWCICRPSFTYQVHCDWFKLSVVIGPTTSLHLHWMIIYVVIKWRMLWLVHT